MKREFDIGDIAHLSNNKKGIGFIIKSEQEVRILGYHKIDVKHGAYLYDIETTDNKGNKVVLDKWLTQFDLMTKDMWNKNLELKNKIEGLKDKLKE